MAISRLILALTVPVTLSLSFACGSSNSDSGNTNGGLDGSTNGTSGGSNGGAGNGTGSTGGVGTSGGRNLGGQDLVGVDAGAVNSLCGGDGCGCSNGKDDDGDGLVDGFDPECTGPFDNDENTFATGIPGDNKDPKWQDCFFDGNSGAGDDGCRYATGCLTGELEQTDNDCKLTRQCLDYCAGLTPNGCDCFGCCTIFTAGGPLDVQIGTQCSIEKIDDQNACPRCTKSTQCGNNCGECELCLGKTAADLPDSCKPTPPPPGAGGASYGGSTSYDGSAPPPPSYTCDNGETVCAAAADCPTNYYCQLGCCIQIIR